MATTRARIAAITAAGLLALTACSDNGDDDTAPAAAPQGPGCQDPNISVAQRALCGPGSGAIATPDLAAPSVALPAASPRPAGCDDPQVSMQYWLTLCGGTVDNHPGEADAAPSGPLPLGEAANTSGDTNYGTAGGTLELTPTTVVYHTGGSPNGSPYVTVTVKTRNGGAVVAEPTDGTSGRGFEYITGEGEQLNTKVGLIPDGFDGNSSAIQPGTFQWAAYTWGVKENQRGGTLQYTDGTGVVFKWTLPAQDTGPQVAEVRDGF